MEIAVTPPHHLVHIPRPGSHPIWKDIHPLPQRTWPAPPHPQEESRREQQGLQAWSHTRRFPTCIDLAPSSPTTPERERKEIEQEIQKLEELIMQARIQDALELHHHKHGPGALARMASSEDLRDLIALTTPNAKPFNRSSLNMEPGDKEARDLASSLGHPRRTSRPCSGR